MRVGTDPGSVCATSYTCDLSATSGVLSSCVSVRIQGRFLCLRTHMTYQLRSPRDRRPLPDGPHDHGGADGERADSGRRAACPGCFPLIDDCGSGCHLKVRQSGHARRHCCGRGGHFEVRRPGHLSRRCTGPFEKENNAFLCFLKGWLHRISKPHLFPKFGGFEPGKVCVFF